MDPNPETQRKQRIPWGINIEPCHIGYIVQVGCKRMAFATMQEIVDGLIRLDADYMQAEIFYFGHTSPEVAQCEEPRDACVDQGLVPPSTRLESLSGNSHTDGRCESGETMGSTIRGR